MIVTQIGIATIAVNTTTRTQNGMSCILDIVSPNQIESFMSTAYYGIAPCQSSSFDNFNHEFEFGFKYSSYFAHMDSAALLAHIMTTATLDVIYFDNGEGNYRFAAKCNVLGFIHKYKFDVYIAAQRYLTFTSSSPFVNFKIPYALNLNEIGIIATVYLDDDTSEMLPIYGNTSFQNQIQYGMADILKTTTQTQLGNSFVVFTPQQTQLGMADIAETTTQIQSGISFIVHAQYQVGMSNIFGTQTQLGIADIAEITTQTQSGMSDIEKTITQTQSGMSDITGIPSLDITHPAGAWNAPSGYWNTDRWSTTMPGEILLIELSNLINTTGFSKIAVTFADTAQTVFDLKITDHSGGTYLEHWTTINSGQILTMSNPATVASNSQGDGIRLYIEDLSWGSFSVTSIVLSN